MFIGQSHFFGTVSKFPEQFFAFFLDWIFYYYFLFSLCSSWPSFDRTSPKLSRSSACCCRCRRTIWVRKIWKKCPSSLDLLYHSTLLQGGCKSKNQCLQILIKYTFLCSKWRITLERFKIEAFIALNLPNKEIDTWVSLVKLVPSSEIQLF